MHQASAEQQYHVVPMGTGWVGLKWGLGQRASWVSAWVGAWHGVRVLVVGVVAQGLGRQGH